MPNPFILTLAIDKKSQDYFNKQRQKYFPSERNYLDAHLTLFHQLPANETKLINDLNNLALHTPVFNLAVNGLMSTGNGVAYKIESDKLSALHHQLQTVWQPWLIPQDKQKLRPHITVQNKVSADEARQLLNKLSVDFEPFEITATGLSLWEYLGGPWKFVERFEFVQ